MSIEQLDMFQLHKIEESQSIKRDIYSRLKHYGIDDYYAKNIKGNSTVFWIIQERLSKLPNFKEYKESLIRELTERFPVVSYKDSWGMKVNCLVELENDCWKYHIPNSMQGPFYCLEMIDDDFFIN